MNRDEILEQVKIFDSWVDQLPEKRLKQIHVLLEGLGQRYFTAPASGAIHRHEAEPGGLLVHSLSVLKNLIALDSVFGKSIPLDSMIICGLFHDLGKIGTLDGLDMYIPVSEQWRRDKGYRYEFNKTIKDGLTHAQRSVRLLSHFGVYLSDDEYLAMLYHDGLYLDENAALKKVHDCKLAMLMHWADYYTAFFDSDTVERTQ